MPANFSINSINPWRSILFGSIGVLLPIALYLIPLEFISVEQKKEYRELTDWLFLPVMGLSFLMGYLGMKFSAYRLEISLDEKGIMVIIKPRLFIIPDHTRSYGWNELLNYSLTEDSKGKVLEITMRNHKKITIGIAYILNKPDSFDAFYSEFLIHLNKFNKNINIGSSEIPIEKTTGFYQSKAGKIMAYLILLIMVTVIALFFISGKSLTLWNLFRFVFFELLGGLYVWRALFGKS